MLMTDVRRLLLVFKNSTWLYRCCSLAGGRCARKQTNPGPLPILACSVLIAELMKLTSLNTNGSMPVHELL